MIIVRPREGLANRLRVVNSALILAKNNNVKRIYVLWIQSEELNASFQDLFLLNDSIILINKSFLYDLFFKKGFCEFISICFFDVSNIIFSCYK